MVGNIRLIENDIAQLARKNIKSDGYVMSSLEAAFWCLLNSENYDKYEILIKILTSICLFSVGALILYFGGVGLVKMFSSFFNN